MGYYTAIKRNADKGEGEGVGWAGSIELVEANYYI